MVEMKTPPESTRRVAPMQKSMATRNLDLAGMTKRVLVRAGIIDHGDLRCRRKGCGHRERRDETPPA